MIISHKHKFIFLKCRKTAGTSLEMALSSICGADDVITRLAVEDEEQRKAAGFRTTQNCWLALNKYKPANWLLEMWRLRKLRFYNHMTAEEIKRNIAPEIWENYFKFCFERNPFDKVISHYYWRRGAREFDTIAGYLQSKEVKVLKGYDLYTINNAVAVDRIFRYENITESLEEISAILKLPGKLKLPEYKAKSKSRKDKRHYSEVLTAEERALTEIIFAREIKLLGYKF